MGTFFLALNPSILVFLDVPEHQDQERKLSQVAKSTSLAPLPYLKTLHISTGVPGGGPDSQGTLSKGGSLHHGGPRPFSPTLAQRHMIWAVYGVWALTCGWRAPEPLGSKVSDTGLLPSCSRHIKRPKACKPCLN